MKKVLSIALITASLILAIFIGWRAQLAAENGTNGDTIHRDGVATSQERSGVVERTDPETANHNDEEAMGDQPVAGYASSAEEGERENASHDRAFIVLESGVILFDGDRPPPDSPVTGPPGTEHPMFRRAP